MQYQVKDKSTCCDDSIFFSPDFKAPKLSKIVESECLLFPSILEAISSSFSSGLSYNIFARLENCVIAKLDSSYVENFFQKVSIFK